MSLALLLPACQGKAPIEAPKPRAEVSIPRPAEGAKIPAEIGEAFDAAVAAVAAAPGQAAPWMRLGGSYEANRFPRLGRDCYLQAVELAPRSAHHAYRLALVQRELSEQTAAYDSLARSLQLEEGYAPSWRRLGDWYLADGDLAAASGAYGKALEVDPGDVGAAAGRTRTLLQGGRPQDAVRFLQNLPSPVSEVPYLLFLRGTALRRLGDFDGALAALSQAGSTPSRSFKDPWADELGLLVRGLAHRRAVIDSLIENARWQEAREQLEPLVAERPGFLALRLQLAQAYRELGESELALAQLDASVLVQPKHPELRLERALLFAAALRFEEALADLESPLAGQRTAARAGLVKLAIEGHGAASAPDLSPELEERFPSTRVAYEELADIQARLGWRSDQYRTLQRVSQASQGAASR